MGMESPFKRRSADDSYRVMRAVGLCFAPRWRSPTRFAHFTLALGRQGRRGVGRTLGIVAESIRSALANYQLSMLLLGVVAIAILFLAIGTESPTLTGILGVGIATAFVEIANRRNRKP